jgi:hypothetical protein
MSRFTNRNSAMENETRTRSLAASRSLDQPGQRARDNRVGRTEGVGGGLRVFQLGEREGRQGAPGFVALQESCSSDMGVREVHDEALLSSPIQRSNTARVGGIQTDLELRYEWSSEVRPFPEHLRAVVSAFPRRGFGHRILRPNHSQEPTSPPGGTTLSPESRHTGSLGCRPALMALVVSLP